MSLFISEYHSVWYGRINLSWSGWHIVPSTASSCEVHPLFRHDLDRSMMSFHGPISTRPICRSKEAAHVPLTYKIFLVFPNEMQCLCPLAVCPLGSALGISHSGYIESRLQSPSSFHSKRSSDLPTADHRNIRLLPVVCYIYHQSSPVVLYWGVTLLMHTLNASSNNVRVNLHSRTQGFIHAHLMHGMHFFKVTSQPTHCFESSSSSY